MALPLSRGPKLSSSWFWATVLTMAASLLHGGRSIIFLDGIPGNMADTRLVNCILEHVYQWTCGYTSLFSPSQFYPVTGTLVYSDSHFGTVLFYALFRVAGASMETAFQAWFLIVLTANTAALLFLFRRLQIAPWIAAPLAFFGTSSAALVFKTGHPQVMPFFAFIMALSFLLQFLRTKDARTLAWVLVWFGYQNACYFYHGFFSLLILGTVTVIYLIFNARKAWWRDFLSSLRQHWAWLLSAICLLGALLVILYYPYVQYAAHSGTRPMGELISLAPRFGAWFSASPFSALYSSQRFLLPEANAGENTLFASWLIWLLVFLGLGCFFKRRASENLRLAAVLALSVLALMAAFTTWPGGASLFLWCAGKIAALRAFRAFGRIGYLFFVMEAVVAACLLDALQRSRLIPLRRVLAVLVAFAIGAETIARSQAFYTKPDTRARVAGLIEMWRRAGMRDILVFAPGYTNQALEIVHTDCWNAALVVRKSSVNGYSGNIPPPFASFLGAPTIEHANALTQSYGLPSERISLVTDWEPGLATKLGLRKYELAQPLVPITDIRALTLTPHAETAIPAQLQYRGATELPCDILNIFASYRIYDSAGVPVSDPSSVRTRVHTIAPGTSPLVMRLVAPSQPGKYKVQFSMVHEGVAWWADLGLAGSVLTLTVKDD